MWVGILVALDGQAVPELKDYGGFQLAFTEGVHHGAGC